jgi:branched-chain amino acid transport system substrate-binding protein
MLRIAGRAAALTVAAAMTVTGCSSSGGAAGGGTSGGSKTLKIGVIYPATGPFAVVYGKMYDTVKARIDKANAENEVPGVKLEVVGRDDASTPSGALSAAKDLVENEHVFGVIEPDPVLFGAYRYLNGRKIPTTGSGLGPELSDRAVKSIFFPSPRPDLKYPVASTGGLFLKAQGGTSLAVVSYADAPSSVTVGKSWAFSAKAAGLKAPYVNTTTVKVGNQNWTAVALAIKQSGADTLVTAMDQGAEANLSNALRQAGVTMKVALSGGYGSDALADPNVVSGKQGWNIVTPVQIGAPVELHTKASDAFAADLKKYLNLDGPPPNYVSFAWMPADVFVHGLATGGAAKATQATWISALSNEHNYNPYGGLYGDKGLDLGVVGGVQFAIGPNNCWFFTKLEGRAFVPVKGADPICGDLLPDSNQG